MSDPEITYAQVAESEGATIEPVPEPVDQTQAWPWGSGTVDDPYYIPDDHQLGDPIPGWPAPPAE